MNDQKIASLKYGQIWEKILVANASNRWGIHARTSGTWYVVSAGRKAICMRCLWGSKRPISSFIAFLASCLMHQLAWARDCQEFRYLSRHSRKLHFRMTGVANLYCCQGCTLSLRGRWFARRCWRLHRVVTMRETYRSQMPDWQAYRISSAC